VTGVQTCALPIFLLAKALSDIGTVNIKNENLSM
jgi:hypothetical protein